ncbi:MAG: hypothetical protein WAU01_17875 [Saprospiraceae bacterium]
MTDSRDKLYQEEVNKRRGLVASLIIHAMLLLFLFIPFVAQPLLEENGGILLAFGDPDAGMESNPLEGEAEPTNTSPAPAQPTTTPVVKSDDVPSDDKEDVAPIKASDKKSKPNDKVPEKSTNKPVVDSKAKEEADRKTREAAEKAKAEREAAARQAEMDSKKQKYSDLLGKGKGNNNADGNQGNQKGDPDGQALEGLAKGSGRVGGGLSGRGVEYEPTFTDNSQKYGRVSLAICVNSEGKVSKADFTQKGSTTSDAYLIDLARKTALKYKFSKSNIDSQCGTITIDFKLQ